MTDLVTESATPPTYAFSPRITFGKYRGRTLDDIAGDTSYLRWLLSLAGDGCAAEFATDNKAAIISILNAEQDAKIAELPPVTVTKHQQAVVDVLQSYITNGDNVVGLEGGAGYGKSYAVKKLLLQLREQGIQSRACATSYVATQVLAECLEPYGFECATVARTIKLSKVFRDGEEAYELTRDSYEAASKLLSRSNALVVDECSMVSDEIGEMLINAAQRNGGTLILVGDSYQLPPVGQNSASICCFSGSRAVLTVQMRYSVESPLYALEQIARVSPHKIIDLVSYYDAGDEIARVTNAEDLVARFVSNFANDPAASHRMLLFRRQDVVNANNAIRTHLFGIFTDGDVEVGEQLMVLRTSDYPHVARGDFTDATRYYSGQSFIVEECYKDTHLGIPHWKVRFQGRREPVRIVFAVNENKMDESKLGGKEYSAALDNAYREGRSTSSWESYKQLQGDFVSVAYRYATSIHRAQGQTTDYTYTVPHQLLGVNGLIGRALTYVALTRARRRVTVLM